MGYNVAIQVSPTKYAGKVNCKNLLVTAPDAPDAYLYPTDNLKTHNCPMDEIFDVTFCPGKAYNYPSSTIYEPVPSAADAPRSPTNELSPGSSHSIKCNLKRES